MSTSNDSEPPGKSSSSDTPKTSFGNILYTEEERLYLQKALSEKIDAESIATRPGPGGGTVSYLETWKAIELANQILGYNGWSSSIVEITQDYLDQTPNGRFNAGVSAIMRVQLKDGSFHEDIGYGNADNQKHKGAALEIAKKKAVSDALKRALRNLGNALGLTIYDKEYVSKTKKKRRVKTTPAPKAPNPFYTKQETETVPSQQNAVTPQNNGKEKSPQIRSQMNNVQVKQEPKDSMDGVVTSTPQPSQTTSLSAPIIPVGVKNPIRSSPSEQSSISKPIIPVGVKNPKRTSSSPPQNSTQNGHTATTTQPTSQISAPIIPVGVIKKKRPPPTEQTNDAKKFKTQ